MFNVVAHALTTESPDGTHNNYQMSAKMSVQYNEFKTKLNDGGKQKKQKIWPTLRKLQVYNEQKLNFVLLHKVKCMICARLISSLVCNSVHHLIVMSSIVLLSAVLMCDAMPQLRRTSFSFRLTSSPGIKP